MASIWFLLKGDKKFEAFTAKRSDVTIFKGTKIKIMGLYNILSSVIFPTYFDSGWVCYFILRLYLIDILKTFWSSKKGPAFGIHDLATIARTSFNGSFLRLL